MVLVPDQGDCQTADFNRVTFTGRPDYESGLVVLSRLLGLGFGDFTAISTKPTFSTKKNSFDDTSHFCRDFRAKSRFGFDISTAGRFALGSQKG